jgi:glycosyltransferase involved in cell wall biosynthesis
MATAPIAILILTKNEQENLPFALASVTPWASQVFVLDSGSTDCTEQIAQQFNATFVAHPWEGYARQKNWALDHLPLTAPWVFILDADEAITPALKDELSALATADNCPQNGFYVNRFFIFLGRRIRHCGYYPSWNLRFFRRGKARYEERDVHEHMVLDGPAGYLKHVMEHNDRRGMEQYIAKHNHYSTLEARELYKIERDLAQRTMHFSFWGGPIQRRRWVKHKIWPRLPAKWFFRWFYMYILKLGFLDGVVGFHFCLFLASYEHQITLKIKELRQQNQSDSTLGQSGPLR